MALQDCFSGMRPVHVHGSSSSMVHIAAATAACCHFHSLHAGSPWGKGGYQAAKAKAKKGGAARQRSGRRAAALHPETAAAFAAMGLGPDELHNLFFEEGSSAKRPAGTRGEGRAQRGRQRRRAAAAGASQGGPWGASGFWGRFGSARVEFMYEGGAWDEEDDEEEEAAWGHDEWRWWDDEQERCAHRGGCMSVVFASSRWWGWHALLAACVHSN